MKIARLLTLGFLAVGLALFEAPVYAQDEADAGDVGQLQPEQPVRHGLFRGLRGSLMAREGLMARDGSGPFFVDEDGDGVCDNVANAGANGLKRGLGRGLMLRDGSGLRGQGPMFIDEDGDGICDRFQKANENGLLNGIESSSSLAGSRGALRMGRNGMGGGRR